MNYFQTKRTAHKPLTQKQLDMKQLHWEKYLAKYPLCDERVWIPVEQDSSMYFDMDRDPNITIEEQ